MYRFITGALIVALSLAPWAAAKGKKAKPPAGDSIETKDTGATVPPAAVEKRVEQLTRQIHWHSSLEEAKAQAQKENKPIFWLHALGDLDGTC